MMREISFEKIFRRGPWIFPTKLTESEANTKDFSNSSFIRCALPKATVYIEIEIVLIFLEGRLDWI